MIRSPIGTSAPTLDARWIISLWIAVHGAGAMSDASGELMLEADAVRAAAASVILALSSMFAGDIAQAIAAALGNASRLPDTVSNAQLEDALKRLGVRLYDRSDAGAAPINGVSVAGFGKICWDEQPI
jgi:hypothetical protein